MDELEMFDENYEITRHAKVNDPETSFEAARVTVKRLSENKLKVLAIFDSVAPNGLIDEELEAIAQEQGMRPHNAQKRRSDLSNDGKLVWHGEHRPTSSGCKARVWHKA